MKKLTIGSAVYDDFEGVYFSYQSLRLNNLDLKNDIEYIIIDNNPSSSEGKAVKHFCESTKCIKYIPYTKKRSTSVRNEIFKNSTSEFTLCMDPHVLFETDTIKKLINFFDKNKESKDLYHGPMLYDIIDGHDPVTHMDPLWRDNMFGVWGYDKKGINQDSEPFEIPMHGLGVFACKTDAWLGFNEKFTGFGGEEGYIHKKFQKQNRKIWCLPFFRWIHRFQRPLGVKYPLIMEERVRNYLLGHQELGLDLNEVISHFKSMNHDLDYNQLINDLDKEIDFEFLEKKQSFEKKSKDQRGCLSVNSIQSWEKSEINFKSPCVFKYIKYEIYDSYDNFASLRGIKILPKQPEHISIHSFSSEHPDFPASNFLVPDKAWRTIDNNSNFIILDIRSPVSIEKIITYAPLGLGSGVPVEFKVFASNDLIQWTEISHVNIFED